jgi:hypothetical protein
MTTAAVDPATCTQCGTTAPLHMMLTNETGALTCNACRTHHLGRAFGSGVQHLDGDAAADVRMHRDADRAHPPCPTLVWMT